VGRSVLWSVGGWVGGWVDRSVGGSVGGSVRRSVGQSVGLIRKGSDLHVLVDSHIVYSKTLVI